LTVPAEIHYIKIIYLDIAGLNIPSLLMWTENYFWESELSKHGISVAVSRVSLLENTFNIGVEI